MLDRWAFGMSKIDGSASTAPSGPGSFTSPPGGAARDSSVDAKEVHAVEMDQASERIAQLLREPGFDESNSHSNAHKPSGPSLLSQQAPPHGRPTGSQRIPADGSDDGFSPPSSGAGSSMALDPQSGGLEAVDRITVKIADLGNGERPSHPLPLYRFPALRAHHVGGECFKRPGWSTILRMISKRGSIAAQRCCWAHGGVQVRISGVSLALYALSIWFFPAVLHVLMTVFTFPVI